MTLTPARDTLTRKNRKHYYCILAGSTAFWQDCNTSQARALYQVLCDPHDRSRIRLSEIRSGTPPSSHHAGGGRGQGAAIMLLTIVASGVECSRSRRPRDREQKSQAARDRKRCNPRCITPPTALTRPALRRQRPTAPPPQPKCSNRMA